MTDPCPLERLERIKAMLAEDLARLLKDAAGIIIPAGVDAHQMAAGARRIITIISDECEAITVVAKPQDLQASIPHGSCTLKSSLATHK